MFAHVVRICPRKFLAALALTAAVAAQGRAEHSKPSPPQCCPFPAAPGTGLPPVVPPVMPRAEVPPEGRPAESDVSTSQSQAERDASSEGEGEAPGAFALGDTPSVLGDLLYTSRSVTFGFIRVNGVTNFS